MPSAGKLQHDQLRQHTGAENELKLVNEVNSNETHTK